MQNKDQTQIAGAIIIAGVIIGGAILIRGNGSNYLPQVDRSVGDIQARALSKDEHILGSPDAAVVVIEYSDTECPFCKVFHNTLHKIIEKNNGEVAWVYRHYPIPELHKKAFGEALATECAWDQGNNDAFWEYIDEVFARTSSNDRLEAGELPRIADDLGLDVSAFNACTSSGKFSQKVEADVKDGQLAGASGTPFSVLVAKKNISAKQQQEIIKALPKPEYVTFDPKRKNTMSLSGALPEEMISKIVEILLD